MSHPTSNSCSGELYDAIILGAGISGLTTADCLARQGKRVVVVDNYPTPGGNHLSKDIDGGTYDIGTILFDERDPQFSLFPGTREICVRADRSMSRIAPDGIIRKYPFAFKEELMERSPDYIARALLSAAAGRLSPRPDLTAADYAHRCIGKRVFEDSGLSKYIERLFGVPPQHIDIAFAHKRMSWIETHSSLQRISRKLLTRFTQSLSKEMPDPTPPPFQTLVRPREGFRVYYEKICEKLQNNGVKFRFSAGVQGIEYLKSQIRLGTSSGLVEGLRVINSMPLSLLFKWLGSSDPLDLETCCLTTLCCSFSGERGFKDLVLYNFHKAGFWKRLTMHSDCYGKDKGREYFSLEISQLKSDRTAAALFEDFRRHTQLLGLFSGDLRLEGHFKLGEAYPLYRFGTETKVQIAIQRLAAHGIECVGRHGRFDYIPSSRQAVDLAQDAYAPSRKGA